MYLESHSEFTGRINSPALPAGQRGKGTVWPLLMEQFLGAGCSARRLTSLSYSVPVIIEEVTNSI